MGDMPGKVQNPDRWFYNARLRAGFRNAASLAQRLGVSRDTILLWDRGVHRPPRELVYKIADAFKLPAPDVAEAVWEEKIGDLCPCGCGGRKVFEPPEGSVFVDADPSQLRRVRMLPIALPCAKCGKIRIHLHRKTRGHPKLCRSCSRLADRTPFTCVGYAEHNATRHAKGCLGTIDLAPYEIRSRQRRAKLHPDTFFDPALGKFECYKCAGARRLILEQKRMIKKAREKAHPNQNVKRTKTREDRIEGFREERTELDFGNGRRLLARPPQWAQEAGRRTYVGACKAGKKWPEMTKGCMPRRWNRSPSEFPRSVRFGVCVVCWNKDDRWLIIRKNSANIKLRFHGPCYLDWRSNTESGRHYISLKRRGEEASLPAYKPGRRPKEEGLKITWSWVWQHLAEDTAYSQIAKGHGLAPSTVIERVESIVGRLPESRLVDARFRPQLELLESLLSASK